MSIYFTGIKTTGISKTILKNKETKHVGVYISTEILKPSKNQFNNI